jgi:hypothetical protein
MAAHTFALLLKPLKKNTNQNNMPFHSIMFLFIQDDDAIAKLFYCYSSLEYIQKII